MCATMACAGCTHPAFTSRRPGAWTPAAVRTEHGAKSEHTAAQGHLVFHSRKPRRSVHGCVSPRRVTRSAPPPAAAYSSIRPSHGRPVAPTAVPTRLNDDAGPLLAVGARHGGDPMAACKRGAILHRTRRRGGGRGPARRCYRCSTPMQRWHTHLAITWARNVRVRRRVCRDRGNVSNVQRPCEQLDAK